VGFFYLNKEMNMAQKAFEFPEELYYDKNHHMWVRKDNSATIVVGIDAIGLDNLGDLAYITLRPEGTVVKKGETVGTLEAAKMTGDVFAPVSGRIIAVNNACVENPGLVNSDAYGKGWLLTMEAVNWEEESSQLVHGEDLEPWIAAEIQRLENQGFDA